MSQSEETTVKSVNEANKANETNEISKESTQVSETQTSETQISKTQTSDSILDTNVYNNIEEGSLIVFTVGDEKNPATDDDLKILKAKLFDMFKDTKGIKILALPHNIKVNTFSVPQLRKAIDEIVVSTRSAENNPILDMDF